MQIIFTADVKFDATDQQVRELVSNYDAYPAHPVLNDGEDGSLALTLEVSVAYFKDISAGLVGWRWNAPLTVDGVVVG